MNKIKFLAILAIAAFSNIANAQSTTSASATATIVTPIAITKVTDMNFGNVAVTTNAGTVVLPTSGPRTATGGVTLPAKDGTITAASFSVTGTADYGYTINLPSNAVTLTNTDSSATMTISNFTSSLLTGSSILNGSGNSSFTVGGTLNVAAGQVAGIYTNDKAITVSVNYN